MSAQREESRAHYQQRRSMGIGKGSAPSAGVLR